MKIGFIKLKHPEKVLNYMANNYKWRILKISSKELSFIYTYFDDLGFEYDAYVYIHIPRSNNGFCVHLNKYQIISQKRGMFEDVIDDAMFLVNSYVEDALRNIEIEEKQ